ncbi:MAG: diacylglycerol kinase [Flavobacterium sp. BFFFF2]|nr:MAG: diacylglycerol kinase [Flavobacterium sp. BFFFF2]
MELILAAAVAANGALGKNNQLLWHLPNDFKHFKQLTMGQTLLMGRKTFESLPGLLPGRVHWVISRQTNYKAPEGVRVFADLNEVLATNYDAPLYVIGGGEIYRQTIDLADTLEITQVDATPEADVFFPKIDTNVWHLDWEEKHPADEKHQHSYTFKRYLKIKNNKAR